jgi:hypothetical protein
MTTTERDRIQARIADEAQATHRTRIDLDAFLALKGEARAARWRQWPLSAKEDAIVQQLDRAGLDWDQATIDRWVAHYDAKFALSPIDAAVEAAIERLADENAQHARTAREHGEKADAAFFQRAATAYTNALIEYRRGVRPERMASGAWLLPSRRPSEAPHVVRMDGDYVCDCKAGASMHWPLALIIGIEVATDDMERFDDGDDLAAAAELGRRLAAARAKLMREAA